MKLLTKADILNLPSVSLPAIALTDSPWSVSSLVIRLRHRATESHSMWINRPGYVATQGLLYHEEPIASFLEDHTIKLFTKRWTPSEKRDLEVRIQEKLEAPWYKRRYDVVGILGQAIHLPRLNIPWLNYCSESVISDLHFIGLALDLPLQSSPGQLYDWCLNNSEMEFIGILIPNL